MRQEQFRDCDLTSLGRNIQRGWRSLVLEFQIRFVLEQTVVLASADGTMATVIAPWTSTGYHPDGSPFPRPGRATMTFSKTTDGWLCVHSHMSLNRGVPQQSHASRPVKAW